MLHDAKLRLVQLKPASLSLFFSPSHHNFLLRPLFSSTLELAPEPVCRNPAPFPTLHPTSRPLTMSLAEETKRVVSQFDFSDADVNSHVQEFLKQMGAYN